MKTPRFSVVIPTLNEEKFLPKLLLSLTKQTFRDFEVIVVDGASKDKTIDVVKRWTSKLTNLRFVVLDASGVSRQRNVGAEEARAPLLIFVDADTVLLPEFMSHVTAYIGKTKARLLTTWFKTDGDEPGDAIAGFFGNMFLEGGLMISRPCAPGPLTVVQKNIFFSVGGYDEQTTFGEDHDLGMKLFEKGIKLHILREILYEFSLRRYRREGNVKAFERYARSTFQVLLTKRGPKHMPGFLSGGHLYTSRKKRHKPFVSKEFEAQLREFFREFVA